MRSGPHHARRYDQVVRAGEGRHWIPVVYAADGKPLCLVGAKDDAAVCAMSCRPAYRTRLVPCRKGIVMAHDKQVHFRMSERDYRALKDAAEEEGTTLGTILRREVRKFVGERERRSEGDTGGGAWRECAASA